VFAVRRLTEPRAIDVVATVVAVLGVGVAAIPLICWGTGFDAFGPIRLLAWLLFLHLPVLLLGCAWRFAPGRAALTATAAFCALVAVQALVVEPRWLEVTEHRIESPKIPAPLRLGIVADVQTDRIGAYERRVFEELAAGKPDLVLFAGDYIQVYDDRYEGLVAAFRDALSDSGWNPKLGAVAVRGDIDRDAWPGLFEGFGVRSVRRTQTLAVGPLDVTALSPRDSRDPPPIEPRGRFHIVLGHSPDFAMERPPADLLVAGHTHGGQVRLPGIGPLMTLSSVPRAWAAGFRALPWGGHLLVSRGTGMERRHAPRLRLLCRPQLVFVDLVPAGS